MEQSIKINDYRQYHPCDANMRGGDISLEFILGYSYAEENHTKAWETWTEKGELNPISLKRAANAMGRSLKKYLARQTSKTCPSR